MTYILYDEGDALPYCAVHSTEGWYMRDDQSWFHSISDLTHCTSFDPIDVNGANRFPISSIDDFITDTFKWSTPPTVLYTFPDDFSWDDYPELFI